MNPLYLIGAVGVMALVSYLPRVIPIALVRKKIDSVFLNSFLYYVPFAVLAAMVFPEILYSTGNFNTAAIGFLTALFLALIGKSLMFTAITTVFIVYIAGYFIS